MSVNRSVVQCSRAMPPRGLGARELRRSRWGALAGQCEAGSGHGRRPLPR
jgi:hypothetical protein